MKITAFAGSNSSQSRNKQLVKFALSYFPDSVINLLDLNDFEMPIFSVDREKEGYPAPAYEFIRHLNDCDVIICSLAENNRTYTVAFKNIIDWCSRIDLKFFKNKPMLLMSTSTGRFAGRNVMNAAKNFFPVSDAQIVDTFSLPEFNKTFEPNKGIIDEELLSGFEAKIAFFKKEIGL